MIFQEMLNSLMRPISDCWSIEKHLKTTHLWRPIGIPLNIFQPEMGQHGLDVLFHMALP